MRKLHFLGFALVLATACSGTGDADTDTGSSDGTNSTSDGTDSESSTTGEPEVCVGLSEDATVADGDPCSSNGDCLSGVCLLFRDVPLTADAVCGDEMLACETRMTGTVLNFETGEPLGGVEVRVSSALEASTNPTGSLSLLTTTSDAEGRLDAVSPEPIDASIGVVALAELEGEFYLTATGLASPSFGNLYAPGVGTHDLWVVPTTTLTGWNAMLVDDTEFSPFLPLGEAGGVVGFVRDSTSGEGVSGAVIVSAQAGTTSIIRYLSEDGLSFVDTETASSGIFVLVAPLLAEEFEVLKGGTPIHNALGLAGSAPAAIFSLVIDVTQ